MITGAVLYTGPYVGSRISESASSGVSNVDIWYSSSLAPDAVWMAATIVVMAAHPGLGRGLLRQADRCGHSAVHPFVCLLSHRSADIDISDGQTAKRNACYCMGWSLT